MESRKDHCNIHKCDFCGYGTKLFSNLLQHNRQHSSKLPISRQNRFTCYTNVPEVYKCENCDIETNLKVSLTHHLNLNHKNLEDQSQFTNDILRQCGYCDFQTYSMLFLLKHCLKCDKREDLGTDKDKVVNWLECGHQCSYKTKTKPCLMKHIMRIHSTNFTLLHCENCSFKTKWKHSLRQHIADIHTDSANIVWHHCDKCEFKFKRKSGLKRHIENIHADSANIVWYHCDQCKFNTKWKTNLKQHTTTRHTKSAKVVWYHCNNCKYKTKWKGDLRKHITSVHVDSANILWHHCDKCEFKTKLKTNLKKHSAKMHPRNIVWYRCDKCEYKTKWKIDLKKHITAIHTHSVNIVTNANLRQICIAKK